jgi:hypothetical protein
MTAKAVFWYLAGIAVLPVVCGLRLWKPNVSTDNPFGRVPRLIDRWKWQWVQNVYGNFEDGVSGTYALIWGGGSQAGTRVLYMPGANPSWRALCWNFRNPIHNISHPVK